MSVSVHGDTERTIWFMQGQRNFPADWSAEVVLEPEAVSQYIISILLDLPDGDSERLTLHWKGKGGEVVSSSESLTNWLTCWDALTQKVDGRIWGEPFVKDAESLQTFGQLRNELD